MFYCGKLKGVHSVACALQKAAFARKSELKYPFFFFLEQITTNEKTAEGDKVLWFDQTSNCQLFVTSSPALPIARGFKFRSHCPFWNFSHQ